jgi:hypothetical protein
MAHPCHWSAGCRPAPALYVQADDVRTTTALEFLASCTSCGALPASYWLDAGCVNLV